MATTPAPTPTPKSNRYLKTPSRTLTAATPSKHRLHFPPLKETPQLNHPIDVIARIRNHPDRTQTPVSALHISPDSHTIRVQSEIGYRDFSLDGVSLSEKEDLDGFYDNFIRSRIRGVKLGEKCTVMMYGPTGAGKSYTMFGCAKQPGIVYRALKEILGDEGEVLGFGCFVQISVLEIYNEEIYDLLSNNAGGGLGFGWHKGNASKVRLEVMGKKAKNATFISGNEAGKLAKEVAQVEKRRIVRSTNCNERSSRSHCIIILDVPTVGGRLMLVDMAGSENIDQAGQVGFEAKMQTGKINQGNVALKRVVESIANGDSHVPFRDSKLTMLLQDSFEDDKSKILMVLCASPDPKELHKTISTLEYGAKAKCIIRGGRTPEKDKTGGEDGFSAADLGSRIAAMDQFILKLQMESKRREKERDEAHKELMKKEEEVAALRAKLDVIERRNPVESEVEINQKFKEREQILKLELEMKLQECQKMADEFVEMGRKRMEETILQQQKELEFLRRRLEELETQLRHSKGNSGDSKVEEAEGSCFMKRFRELYANAEKPHLNMVPGEQGDGKENTQVEEIKKVVEESSVHTARRDNADIGSERSCSWLDRSPVKGEDGLGLTDTKQDSTRARRDSADMGSKRACSPLERSPVKGEVGLVLMDIKQDSTTDPALARRKRLQNIFQLCGNHRELSQHVRKFTPNKRKAEGLDSLKSPVVATNGSFVAKSPSKDNSPLRRVLSDLTSNTASTPGSVLNVEQSSAESQLKRSRTSLVSAQELKENSMPNC